MVIVCANEREKYVVNELMELYFPHDPANELPDELVEETPAAEEPKKKSAKGKRKPAKGRSRK